jgi:hypothetical protein
MSDESKNERTADDVLKELTAMEAKVSDPKPQGETVHESEKAENKGNQPPVTKEETAPDADKKDESVKEETPADDKSKESSVDEGDKGKKLTDEEKRDYTFAEMRKKIAEYEKELELLKSNRTETVQTKPEVSDKPKVEQAATPKVSADEVLDIYSRAKSGNLTDDEIALIGNEQNAIALCEKILSEKMSANDIFVARQKMAAAANAEAVEIATKFLPVAQQRERIEADRVQAEKQSHSAKYAEEIERVKKEIPEIIKQDDPLAKYMIEWDNSHLTQFGRNGEVVKQGRLSAEMSRYLIQHPYEHATMVKSYFDQISTAKGTENVLKKKLALSQSAESGSPPSGTTKKERTADDILREMEKLSAGGKSAY